MVNQELFPIVTMLRDVMSYLMYETLCSAGTKRTVSQGDISFSVSLVTIQRCTKGRCMCMHTL